MNLIKRTKNILFIGLITYPIICLVDALSSLGMVKYIIPLFDMRIAQSIQNDIVDQACRYRNNCYNPEQLLEYLKNHFEVIESVSLSSFVGDIALLEVQAYNPLASINTHLVLMDRPLVLNDLMYEKNVVDALEHLVAYEPVLAKPEIIQKVLEETRGKDILKKYSLTICNEHVIQLQDKKDVKCYLVCDSSALPDQKVDDAYALLKKTIQPDTSFNWIFDVRFKDQVIVKRGLRGNYGKV
jgi:hypothetical protein